MKKQIMSIIILVLFLSIPFASAASLSIVTASGEDGYYDTDSQTGYKKQSDTITVEVQADGVSDLSADQVKITRDGTSTLSMDSCSGSDCSKTFRITSTRKAYYTVKLYDADGNYVAITDFYMVPDYYAPEISSFSLDNSLSSDGAVTLIGTVRDYAYSGSSECIGIKEVIITEDDVEVSRFSPIEQSCTFSFSEDYTSSASSGSHVICAKAVDLFDFESSEDCAIITIDRDPPNPVSAEIKDLNGEVLDVISSEAIPIILSVDFDSSDVESASISDESLSLGSPDCNPGGSGVICEWRGSLSLESSGQVSFPVSVTDEAGNTNTATVSSQTIDVDDVKPIFSSIQTDMSLSDGSFLLTTNSNLSVIISEDNLGDNLPSLNLASLGLGNLVVASRCEEISSGSYECFWDRSFSNTEGSYTIRTAGVSDIVGNENDEEISISLTVDTTPPDILSEGTGFITDDPVYEDRIVTNHSVISLSVLVSEDGPLTAYGNFSYLNPDYSNVPGSCSLVSEGRYNCSWSNLFVTSWGEQSFSYAVVDEVGNEAFGSDDIFIYGIGTEEDPLFWSISSDGCSPSKIDRQVTTIRNVRSYCAVDFRPRADAEILEIKDISKSDCTFLGNDSSKVSRISLLGDDIVKVELSTVKMDIDSLEFSCPISVISEVENGRNIFVTENYETHNVTFNLDFYNLPLGEYPDAIKDKILAVRDDSIVGMTWITSLEKLVKTLEKLCNILNTIVTIYDLFTAMNQIISKAEGFPLFEAFVKASSGKLQIESVAETGMIHTAYKFCQYLSCKKSVWGMVAKDSGSFFNENMMANINNKAVDMFGGDTSNLKPSQSGSVTYDPGKDGEGFRFDIQAYDSPRQSLILSVATLCLPGILDNLQRWRQIQCNYGDCLIDSMKMNMPISVCESQKSFQECKYVTGQIFHTLPFVGFIENFLGKMTNILSDPIGFVFGVSGFFCMPLISASVPHAYCHKFVAFQHVVEMASTIKQIFDPQFWTIDPDSMSYDMCEEFETKLSSVGLGEEDEN